jgi:hypothetical protein
MLLNYGLAVPILNIKVNSERILALLKIAAVAK